MACKKNIVDRCFVQKNGICYNKKWNHQDCIKKSACYNEERGAIE